MSPHPDGRGVGILFALSPCFLPPPFWLLLPDLDFQFNITHPSLGGKKPFCLFSLSLFKIRCIYNLIYIIRQGSFPSDINWNYTVYVLVASLKRNQLIIKKKR